MEMYELIMEEFEFFIESSFNKHKYTYWLYIVSINSLMLFNATNLCYLSLKCNIREILDSQSINCYLTQ